MKSVHTAIGRETPRALLPAARVTLLALPLLLSACSLTGGSSWNTFHASAAAGYLETELEGEVVTKSPVETTFDFDDNGGQSDAQSSPYLAAVLGFAPLEFRASAFEYSEEGTGTFTGDFLGTTFTGNVDTDFDIRVYQASLGLDLINLERLRLGVLAGATILDTDLLVTDVGAPTTVEDVDEMIPIPVVGARVDLKITSFLRVGLTGTIYPLSNEVEDVEIDFLDYEAAVYLEPVNYVEIFAMYRGVDLQADGEIDDVDAEFDLNLSGPVFGVAISF